MPQTTARALGSAFDQIQARWKELDALASAMNLMSWDQQTYLPEAAAEVRGTHISALHRMRHELATRDDLGEWLERVAPLADQLPHDSDERQMIREARRDYDRARKVPAELAGRLAETASNAYDLWKKARATEDFKIVHTIMEEMLELSREFAECLRLSQHTSLMDPLIDLADEGFTESQLRPLFADLRSQLVPLIDQIPQSNNKCLLQYYPESNQRNFGEMLIRQLGYDFSRGRQDKAEHPFMIRFAHSDIRITTRYKDRDLSEGLFSTIHEAGHALYELGIDERYNATPLGQGSTDGLHESQSRLWENIVGRSRPFWEHFFPKLQKSFPDQLGRTTLDEFYLAINRVERSLIRTDADEVTYNLHVMIRFDLEAKLLKGELNILDLPEAWNACYQSDLGIKADRPSRGVLQDMHWFAGRIGGMFQGYTIGNILSAQLFSAAKRALPGLEDQFRQGEFGGLRNWLKSNLHRYGRKYPASELIQRATGAPLSTAAYFEYLQTKFLSSHCEI